jgi:hypothetical protein
MKPSVPLDGRTRTGKLALLGVVLLLLGCQSLIFDPRGHQVPEDRRITIPDSGEQAGVYKNEDLRVAYKMVRASGQLRISGEIRFADRISESFPVIQYFNLGAMLLDGQGKILDIANLTSAGFYRTQYAMVPDYPLVFNTSIVLSGSARSFAFHYTGRALDPGDNDGGMMDFWEYPVY